MVSASSFASTTTLHDDRLVQILDRLSLQELFQARLICAPWCHELVLRVMRAKRSLLIYTVRCTEKFKNLAHLNYLDPPVYPLLFTLAPQHRVDTLVVRSGPSLAHLTDECVPQLVHTFPNISTLDIRQVNVPINATMCRLAIAWPRLRSLTVFMMQDAINDFDEERQHSERWSTLIEKLVPKYCDSLYRLTLYDRGEWSS